MALNNELKMNAAAGLGIAALFGGTAYLVVLIEEHALNHTLLQKTYLTADSNSNCKLESTEIGAVMKQFGFLEDFQFKKLDASYSNESYATVTFGKGSAKYVHAYLGKRSLEQYVNSHKQTSNCDIHQFPEFPKPVRMPLRP